jgi:hypothetical protein
MVLLGIQVGSWERRGDLVDVVHVDTRAQRVAPAVREDPEDPGIQPLRVSHLRQPLERLGQGFLHEVICQCGVVRPGIGDLVHARPQRAGLRAKRVGEARQAQQVHRSPRGFTNDGSGRHYIP